MTIKELQKAAKSYKLLRYYQTEDSDGWDMVKAIHPAKDSSHFDLVETTDGNLYSLSASRLEITK